jgi:hypothetical protein
MRARHREHYISQASNNMTSPRVYIKFKFLAEASTHTHTHNRTHIFQGCERPCHKNQFTILALVGSGLETVLLCAEFRLKRNITQQIITYSNLLAVLNSPNIWYGVSVTELQHHIRNMSALISVKSYITDVP